ncbi:hypothetical protein [Salinibacterium sp. M195]|uniref:hypothetical protein n=1 Tax=Salinibacterium sp. M195 TaxID=2583374 RepID=UPI001C6377D1|nr:hypothetical protein [Salinibacterium sp. M195]QYH36942.1 hypothetical protein FFT87_13930 [Salinibacterium sp. M195]
MTRRARLWIDIPLVFVGAAAMVLITWSRVSNGYATAERPSPALIVERYLAALEVGEAEAAAELDPTLETDSLYSDTDRESFLADEVLSGAIERISETSVEVVATTETEAKTIAQFALDGTVYRVPLNLEWNDELDEWELQHSLANYFDVFATDEGTSPFAVTSLDFTLAGVRPNALSEQSERNGLGYTAYPAVYKLDVEIDAESLIDAGSTPTMRDFVVVPFTDHDYDPHV